MADTLITLNWTRICATDYVSYCENIHKVYTLIYSESNRHWMLFLDGAYLAHSVHCSLEKAKEAAADHANASLI